MRPTPGEDRELNEAMGRAAVAGDDRLIGGLPNFQAMLAEREKQARERATERANKSGLTAYPVLGFGAGWFAVPSQSELGHVYLVHLNVYTGDPNSCTCPNPQRWCSHSGAARRFYDAARDIDDQAKAQEAAAGIIHMKERSHEHAD